MIPENIKKACELAKDPGSCKYTDGEKPLCVIAQLYVLEGGDVKDMLDWGTTVIRRVEYNSILENMFDKYGLNNLVEMQYIWDKGEDEIASRNSLLKFVEEASF